MQDGEPKKQSQPLQAMQGAILAAMFSAGVCLGMPQGVMPAARAESTFATTAERRKFEAQQRKELLQKAYELLPASGVPY